MVQDWFHPISQASPRFYKLLLHGCIPSVTVPHYKAGLHLTLTQGNFLAELHTLTSTRQLPSRTSRPSNCTYGTMVRVGSSSTHRRRSPPSEVDASEEGIVIGETAMLYYDR